MCVCVCACVCRIFHIVPRSVWFIVPSILYNDACIIIDMHMCVCEAETVLLMRCLNI